MHPAQLDDALYRACIEADLAQVKLLVLEHKAEVNKIIGLPNQLDYTINHATKTGSIPLVRFLLDSGGATVNAGALQIAAFGGDLPMLQLLLEPIKSHLATSGMSRKWRVDLASILVGTTRRGHSETAEALKVFRARVDDFDKVIDSGLLAACAAGDMRSVKYFVGMGAGNHAQAVSTAAEYNQFEPMQYFLDIHSFEPEELSDALISAAANGHMPSINLLVDQGADDESGAALAKAAKFCHQEAAQYLVATFTYKTDALSTALSAAARTGDTAIMNMLIHKGAQGSGALIVAVQRSQLAATELLVQTLTLSQLELSKALEKAMFVWLRPPQTRRSILSRTSSNVSTRSTFDDTPDVMSPPALSEVRKESQSRIVDILLEAGARLSELYYCRLLEMTILTKNSYCVTLLEENYKFTTVETLPDEYLISLAIYHQQENIVDLLLGYPIAHNREPEEGIESGSILPMADTINTWESKVYNPIPSPLILAAEFGNERWCRTLLAREETDVNEWCYYKPTKRLLSYYGSSKKTQTCREEQYEELGSPFGTEPLRDCALSMALRSRDLSMIKVLVEYGADPWINREGISMLELAAKAACLQDLVQFLDESRDKFDMDKREWEGEKRILHWAAIHGNGDLINWLCRKGAVIDTADGLLQTPLHVAVVAGNIDTVKELLWAGASTSRRDLQDFLCVDELAAKLAQDTPWSDSSRAVRFEISRFLEDWVKNNMDHLDAANIRRESKAAEDRAMEREASQSLDGDLLDHFSDEESVHWSDADDDIDGGNGNDHVSS
jgi:ankyrin repeat protein